MIFLVVGNQPIKYNYFRSSNFARCHWFIIMNWINTTALVEIANVLAKDKHPPVQNKLHEKEHSKSPQPLTNVEVKLDPPVTASSK